MSTISKEQLCDMAATIVASMISRPNSMPPTDGKPREIQYGSAEHYAWFAMRIAKGLAVEAHRGT